MMRTYGPADALHKMRHSRWLDRDSEEKVLAAATLLLAAGAHVNIPEERVGYWTPSILHWAVSKNYTHVVDLLHAQAVVDENVVCAAAAQVSGAQRCLGACRACSCDTLPVIALPCMSSTDIPPTGSGLSWFKRVCNMAPCQT